MVIICLAVARSLALGVEDRRIPDGAISASSIWDYNHRASNARLNAVRRGHRTGGWSSRHNKRGQWIQVDIGTLARVTGVALQGRQDYSQWVTRYVVKYSVNGRSFTTVRAGVRTAVSIDTFPFLCLGANHSPALHTLPREVLARLSTIKLFCGTNCFLILIKN